MLLLDALASVWAAGAAPTVMQLDAFGNPLCLVDVGTDDPQPDGGHSKTQHCCVIGCSMSAAIAPAPAGTVLFPGPATQRATPGTVYRPAARAPPDYDPGNPRAPPLTA